MQQIAQAMEHLAAEQVTHCDLAARNALLFGFDKNDVRLTSVKVSLPERISQCWGIWGVNSLCCVC